MQKVHRVRAPLEAVVNIMPLGYYTPKLIVRLLSHPPCPPSFPGLASNVILRSKRRRIRAWGWR